ncbi:programmed cell death 1 ligand 1-like [Cygnus atratus]|uniref:programmed cell death 1 ligand 1-like n=1 Tax=Cygnus atratus TaxID=8868 RepID=UPI0015D6566C|nr:programmed cell death 1 ligand 1-like [Cygnus atratus]XP_035401472.1 programmed cell death 1 ligand 1-like [Cygnus atratus]XP_050564769.1 programmed cell death 1 ligand 1-like [Cygnus atratus]XP_050564785.1 programmed cell death 1 ligand 1-like [Cygnus atratus]
MKWETLWTVACLLFASLPRGQPDTTCHAFVGESVILPCATTSPSELDVSNLMLYWQIESNIVHFFHNGEDKPTFQNTYYSGRTSLFLDQVKHGNFSLKLSNVQLQDAAVYSCISKQTGNHPTPTQKSKIQLNVSDRSSTGEEHSASGHSQISSRSPGNVPHLDVLLSFHLLVTLWGWRL